MNFDTLPLAMSIAIVSKFTILVPVFNEEESLSRLQYGGYTVHCKNYGKREAQSKRVVGEVFFHELIFMQPNRSVFESCRIAEDQAIM